MTTKTASRRSLMKGLAWTAPSAVVIAAAPAYAASQCTLATADKYTVSVKIDMQRVLSGESSYRPLVPLADGVTVTDSSGNKKTSSNDPRIGDVVIPKGSAIARVLVFVDEEEPLSEAIIKYPSDVYSITVSDIWIGGGATRQTVMVYAARDIKLSEVLGGALSGKPSIVFPAFVYSGSFDYFRDPIDLTSGSPYLYSGGDACDALSVTVPQYTKSGGSGGGGGGSSG